MYHFFLRKSFREYVKYRYKKEIVRNNHIEVSNSKISILNVLFPYNLTLMIFINLLISYIKSELILYNYFYYFSNR